MSVTVFVKGSNDHFKVHKELGDCPSSQRIVMILRLKGVPFHQEFVDLTKKDTKKWDEFVRRTQGRLKPPVLIHGDLEPIEDADAIVGYLEETFPEPDLKSLKAQANIAGRDLYSKFALFMRNSIPDNDAKLRAALVRELKKLNEFLDKESPGAYLDGDKLKLPDCNLLPKLMHIKVAGELKGFTIPEEFEAISTYLRETHRQKAFKETFTEPVKHDIKQGWLRKMGNSMGTNSHR